jgi:hypothetical protein
VQLLAVAAGLISPALGWQGGNVVITVRRGVNLPSLDGFGSAGFTDAYIKVSAEETGHQGERACTYLEITRRLLNFLYREIVKSRLLNYPSFFFSLKRAKELQPFSDLSPPELNAILHLHNLAFS